MADLTITAGGVLKLSGSSAKTGTLFTTSTAGQPVYINGSGTLSLCDATILANTVANGVLLTGGSASQPAIYQTTGDINISATTVKGGVYCVSPNSGKIAPYADITTGKYVFVLGIASDTAGTLSINLITTNGGPVAK